MPPMKIQPINSPTMRESVRAPDSAKPVFKSRLRRLFDRQFPGVLRVSTSDKQILTAGEVHISKDCPGAADFEPSSLCLANMVQNFIEESNDKQSVAVTAAKCGRNRCNCFNGNNNDSSDEEFDFWSESATNSASYGDLIDVIKSLVPCTSMVERNLLADTAKIVEQQSKSSKRKDELRSIVTESLSTLGYDASICKSRWEKSSSYPAGEYEYIDVVVAGGERLLIDVDFRSEFEIARSTGTYKTILQSLPFIFVGRADRLEQIVSALSEAAKHSLKKKGMHIPPWRKAEYMRAKWLSPCARATESPPRPSEIVDGDKNQLNNDDSGSKDGDSCTVVETETEIEAGELELIFGEQSPSHDINPGETTPSVPVEETASFCGETSPALVVVKSPWQPPALRPRSSGRGGAKVVTGLASLLREKL
ncbi:hypothetical protein V2J09_014234 [Rumex salicifolius]